MTISNLANHKHWFPQVDKQTHMHWLMRKDRGKTFWSISIIKKSIESTQNVYPIWHEAMSTPLALFGLKTIPISTGLVLDTLEWSGPTLFVLQTSSARLWKAPSTNHRLANLVISGNLWAVFNSLSFSNNFELKSSVVRSTANFWHDEYDHRRYVINW